MLLYIVGFLLIFLLIIFWHQIGKLMGALHAFADEYNSAYKVDDDEQESEHTESNRKTAKQN
jgi:hypothetical protein